MDYNGSFKALIVRDGLDVCGGNVFQSFKTVLGINEDTPRSDTKMWCIGQSILGLQLFKMLTFNRLTSFGPNIAPPHILK